MSNKSSINLYQVIQIDSSPYPFTVRRKAHGLFKDWHGFINPGKSSSTRRFATIDEAKEYIQYRIRLDEEELCRERQEKLKKKKYPIIVWP
jgi:phosphatidate phosphatase PAH1